MADEVADKEKLCMNQLIASKIDSLMVEEDFVVPDVKPDILNTISTNGTVCIEKKEILDGKIKIEGKIEMYIMYMADEEKAGVRSFHTTLDFVKTMELEKAKEGNRLEAKVNLKSLECRVLNGRKVNVKGVLEVEAKLFSNEEIEFMKDLNTVKDIQLLREDMTVSSLLGTGDSRVYAKDTIMIDNIDELAEVMKVKVAIQNKETKISYNKVLTKADAIVTMLYLSTDNRINCVSSSIPVMGFIDMPNVTDENLCEVNYEIKNMLVKPNSIEEHSVYVEIEMELSCNVYETKALNIIQDLYSPTVNLMYGQKTIRATAEKQILQDVCNIREKQVIPELQNQKIYDVDVCPNIQKQTILKDKILCEGEMEITFFYGIENSPRMQMKKVQLSFQQSIACKDITQSASIDTNIEIENQDFVILPDESIDIKIDMGIEMHITREQNVSVIQEIQIAEDRQDEKYSMIIYFVKPGDTLWKIAKRFKSTVDRITCVNEIVDENKINVGEQLFIPMVR